MSLVETIKIAMANKAWFDVAHMISGPTRMHSAVGLNQIDETAKDGDVVIIPGKVLSTGDLTKKVKICALSFSTAAAEKIKKAKAESSTIFAEIKSNPSAKGIKIIQ